MAYLDPKGKGDKSMPGNHRSRPGVWGGAVGDPRDMAKAGLQPFTVSVQERLAIGADSVVHGVPITRELVGHLFERPASAHLHGRPLGGPGGEEAVLGGDAVVAKCPGVLRTVVVGAAQAVLLPRERHWRPIDGKVHVAHDRPVFYLRPAPTARAAQLPRHLLDHELDVGAVALVVHDTDVFQSYQCPEDLTRVAEDEGAT
jgi:hypothetical protein